MHKSSKIKLHILVHYQGEQHRLLIEQEDIMNDNEFDSVFSAALSKLFAEYYPHEENIPKAVPYIVCPDFSKINCD